MKKILLASRYKVLLQRYSNLLVNWGFDLFTATGGVEAFKLHVEHHFDLIIADFDLEGMSMSTFCAMIRNDEVAQSVPIIITCHNIPSRVKRARLIGASAVVLKPIEPVILLEEIGKIVGLNLIRGKRVEIMVVVTVKRNGREQICFSRDISNSGILLKSDYVLHVGDLVTCRFTLPGSANVEFGGEVVRYLTDLECDNLYGIKFNSLTSSHRKAISDYINAPSNSYSTAGAMRSGTTPPAKGHAVELMLQLPDTE